MSNNNEKLVKDIRRRTRKKYSSEEKIRIVLEGMRGEASIAELCRREGLNQNVYYRWSKEFLEAGKQRLAGDIKREASSSEVTGLCPLVPAAPAADRRRRENPAGQHGYRFHEPGGIPVRL